MGPIEDLLRSAYKRIEKPNNWCQGSYAKDAQGKIISEVSPQACSWCLAGSLCAHFEEAIVSPEYGKAFDYLQASIQKFDGEKVSLHTWNDRLHRHHSDVLIVLANAAEMAAKENL